MARHQIAACFDLPVYIAANLDIVVSELIANAVLHGSPPIQVVASLQDGIVRVAVHDQRPEMGSPTPESRGLTIIPHLADQWGVTNEDGGKSVWAHLPAGH